MSRNWGERVGNWVRQHRKWLRVSTCVLVVLAVVGFSARAPLKDLWLAHKACGGKLPHGDVQTVRTDARLGSEEESFDEEQGRYSCVLKNDEGTVVVAVDAYLAGLDRAEEMSSIARFYAPHAVLPGGLPGFEVEYSRVYLMPECPRRAGHALGGHHRLLVGTWTYSAKSREEKSAMLRLAVRMTNEMTERLDCGGEPLPMPKHGAVPDRGKYATRAQAKGTACNALSVARPWEDPEWRVRIAIAEGGVMGRCTLYAPPLAPKDRDHIDPLVELTSWRGNWGGNMYELGAEVHSLPMGEHAAWKPALSETLAWAVARCGGENVGFGANWSYNSPYRADATSETEATRKRQRKQLSAYVTAFAKDQVRRGNCTRLQLPESS
ncbi:hypothetical protein GCM10012287_04390 [Streptomyces daqingensis]|uniref:HNH endonuclease n=1 Tax=Streptomyces daqingensis TaxID=1472640 RepID=A0ABQ2LSP8_9ACTN|nr:hypothetical protein [Streptomyces daqingensis]GGO42760.1 hypothetical protein GCM10012287_04390 [Streptomyces daqingensis]